MNIVAFVPARGGSKSIPQKNIKLLGDKPLISYSIDIGLKCDLRTIVNSEDKEILKIAKEYGAETMKRPKRLAKDKTSMYDLLRKEVFKIDPVPEYIVLLQPTTPFRSVGKVKMAVALLLDNKEYDSLVIAERVPDKYSPEQVIINTPTGLRMADGRKIPERITQRQNHKESYIPQGTYMLKVSNLKKGNLYGDKTMIMETEPNPANINNLDDWKIAEEYVTENHE